MKRNLILAGLALPAILIAQTAKPLAFEVADIKPADPSITKMGKGRMLPGGRIEVPGYTLRELMLFAYGVTDDMISGGPKWVGEERYSIVAKAPDGAPNSDLFAMMQTLLADRFGLVTHREDKPMPAYVMTLVKNGPALKESASGASQCHWTEMEGGLRRRQCTNMTMSDFAKELPATGGIGIVLPVSDQTGLKGKYDLEFDVGSIRRDPASSPEAPPDPLNVDGPSIFAALQKIGLHLESKKIPVSTIVIDKADRPASN
jgi:uncharacterized protein (TIGR03435 family)